MYDSADKQKQNNKPSLTGEGKPTMIHQWTLESK